MAQTETDTGLTGKIGKFSINIGGTSSPFLFPDQPWMRAYTTTVLTGKAYPLPKLPGYEPSLVLDIGAGVGAAALYFHILFPGAAIHSYEPFPASFEFLRRNAAPFPAIVTHDYGLYDKSESVPIYAGKVHNYQASIFQSAETGATAGTIKLEKTADEIRRLGARNISVLKVDTEGCEVPIVTEALEAADTIDFIFVEFHSEENRLALDQMLSPRFLLHSATAKHIHRGECGYVSRAVADRYRAVLSAVPVNPNR